MVVVMALLRGIAPPGKECEEDKPEPAQLHADEIRDENQSTGAKYVLNLNPRKASATQTFRRPECPGKGNRQRQDEESKLSPLATREKGQGRDQKTREPERRHLASDRTGIVPVG